MSRVLAFLLVVALPAAARADFGNTINLTNSSGQTDYTALAANNFTPFVTTFLRSPVTITNLTSSGILPPIPGTGSPFGPGGNNNDQIFVPTSGSAVGNNPNYLTNFVGSPTIGTGDGGTGHIGAILLQSGTSLQLSFNDAIGPNQRLVFGDIDGTEAITIQAYDVNGKQVSLSGWKSEDFTGASGVLPNTNGQRWANFTTSGLSGLLTAPNSGNLNDPLNVLTPNQAIKMLVVTQSVSDGGVYFQIFAVPEPSSIVLTCLGAVVVLANQAPRWMARARHAVPRGR